MNKLTSAVKVLVVDDQPLIVEELCEFLESSGYRCVPCVSSQEAIERFTADAQIGLVVCDLHMPGMDGVEAVRRIRAGEGGRADAPIVALTADAMVGDAERLLAQGFDDAHPKPIQPGRLLATVAALRAVAPRAELEFAQSA